jgi:hypothetical protein
MTSKVELLAARVREAVRRRAAPKVPPGFLTRDQAAKFCGVHVDTFDAHVRPNLEMLREGRKLFVSKASLEAWALTPAADKGRA